MRQIFGKSDGDPANNNPVHVVLVGMTTAAARK